MEHTMKDSDLNKLAEKIIGELKSEGEVDAFMKALKQQFWESALEGEMDEHLGHQKHEATGRGSGNSRNGKAPKRLKGEHGDLEIQTPRDRNATFEPKIVAKRESRTRTIDEKILFLYAKGQSTRDIAETIEELYDVAVSPSLISKVTERVNQRIEQSKARPLDPLYPIVYLDCIALNVRQHQTTIKKSVYLALGVNLEGHKELLGLWLAKSEGAKFWLSVLTELKSRGVQDILIACVDGLKGFPEAIEVEYPRCRVQLCIVHMIHNRLKLVPYKDYKALTADLKLIYPAPSEPDALAQLEQFKREWDEKYAQIGKSWSDNWHNLVAIYHNLPPIRRAIYTTNAVEFLNSVVRKATSNRKVFPDDQSAMKVVFLAIEQAFWKWTMPIRNWKPALNRFILEHGDRITDHL